MKPLLNSLILNFVSTKQTIILLLLCTLVWSCKPLMTSERADLDTIVQKNNEQAELNASYAVISLDELAFLKDQSLKNFHPPLVLNQKVRLISPGDQPIIIASRPFFEIQTLTEPPLTGYASSYFIAVEGMLAVITQHEATISPNPQSMKLTDLVVPAFALITIYPQTAQNGWVLFDYVQENYLSMAGRYIKQEAVSLDQHDINAAIYYQFAISSSSKKLKEQYLVAARDEHSLYSLPYLQAYQDIINLSTIKYSVTIQATIKKDLIATFYAKPSHQSLPLTISRKNSSTVLNLIDRSSTKEQVEGLTDYWYLEGDKGWVFGASLILGKQDPPTD